MIVRQFVAGSAAVLTVLSICTRPAWAQIQYILPDAANGLSKAVVVEAPRLAFTSQIYPLGVDGKVVATNDAAAQTSAALGNLELLLTRKINGKLEDGAKLNVYISNGSDAPAVKAAIASAFPRIRRPAVSFVVTPLRIPGAKVAVDAVCVDERNDIPRSVANGYRFNHKSGFGAPTDVGADMVVVPADRLVLVSGQAERGELRESIRKTCESLAKTVRWAGGENFTVGQIKVFMNSLNDVPAVFEEAAQSGLFGGAALFPAISFVQWTNKGPTEIEVVARAARGSGAATDQGGPVQFLTPPWMTESPVYSKVTVVHSNKLIFTSGLYGTPKGTGEEQVASLFAELEKVTKAAGSDLRHLAKATYYVVNDDVSSKLNTLRPKFYDPKRPPAASKASVQGVGLDGCTITLDMIAVPAKK
jgi:enamine deaminase RidA (YjgF/YER057c/UK114 family)